jgi:RHS repeat-associated protein
VRKVVIGGGTQRFIYSGLETASVFDGSNTWKQNFVFGQGLDEILMLEQADILDFDSDSNTSEITRSFYHRGALGSVMDVRDMSQAQTVNYRYSSYGEMTITRGGTPQSTDPLAQPWTFSSRYSDEETVSLYYRCRQSTGVWGRFLQRDPLVVSDGPNPYALAWNSPTNGIDPLGLYTVQYFAYVPSPMPLPPLAPGLMPGIVTYQAFLDQWLNPGWLAGEPPTWLQRYRDNILSDERAIKTRVQIPCSEVPNFVIPYGHECTCWRITKKVIAWRANQDRGQLRIRQSYVYGQLLRGPRRIFWQYEYDAVWYDTECKRKPGWDLLEPCIPVPAPAGPNDPDKKDPTPNPPEPDIPGPPTTDPDAPPTDGRGI